jgi:hypothetical protein
MSESKLNICWRSVLTYWQVDNVRPSSAVWYVLPEIEVAALSSQSSLRFPYRYYFMEQHVILSHLLCIYSLIFAACHIEARRTATQLRPMKKTFCA